MKIAIVCDSFKGSLSTLELAREIKAGFSRIFPHADYLCLPMADGGEGTVEAFAQGTGGQMMACSVTGPLGKLVSAFWGVSGDGRTAVIEMAAAAGLPLLKPDEYAPLQTTTYGVGELVRAALDHGCQHIIIGLGGSATNDGGAGFAQALGVRLLDERGRDLPPGGAALAHLAQIDASGLDARLAHVTLEGACDVTNPLIGPQGASSIFGPQKGASPQDVAQLEAALTHYATLLASQSGRNIAHISGAGAAGGLGGGLLAFTHATLRSGVEIIAEQLHLAEHFAEMDLILTGEGRMDGQTVHGKAPMGVAQIAKRFGKPVIAIVGSIGKDVELVRQVGIDAVFDTVSHPADLTTMLEEAPSSLRRVAENVAIILKMGQMMKRGS